MNQFQRATLNSINIGQHNLTIQDAPDVWMPHKPTIQFMELLTDDTFIKQSVLKKSILEIGTGTGIIGIYLLKEGASYVAMTDNNYAALENTLTNIKLNDISLAEHSFGLINTDRFTHIQGKFDTIVSSPPVQPTMPSSVHKNNKASKSNESGDDGRCVLDSLIIEGRSFLNKGGVMITSCSSRHGHKQTIDLFNKHWGKNNWEIILDDEYEIDDEYHGPYMEYWIQQQLIDDDLRVYLKDNNGKRYTIESYDPKLKWYFQYSVVKSINN